MVRVAPLFVVVLMYGGASAPINSLKALASQGEGSYPKIIDVPNNLSKATEQITIRDRKILTEIYLWRDFMPFAPANGRPMAAVFNLSADGENPILNNVRVERAWAIWRMKAWENHR